jgi:uracil-DNA glycosylase family 4
MYYRDEFNPTCRSCVRLVRFLTEVKSAYPHYHCQPVAPFGDREARLLIVGLAPGKHGANATGRPFTGDYAGILLYDTLHRYGFSNKAEATSLNDGLLLKNCRITNAVKCLPPDNRPLTGEIMRCNTFLEAELKRLAPRSVVMTLGIVAHNAVLRALGLPQRRYKFMHGCVHSLNKDKWLVNSYHCSRYNIQTGRLTTEKFYWIFDRVQELLIR